MPAPRHAAYAVGETATLPHSPLLLLIVGVPIRMERGRQQKMMTTSRTARYATDLPAYGLPHAGGRRRAEGRAGVGPSQHGLCSDKMALITSDCGEM